MPTNQYGQQTTDSGHVITEHERIAEKVKEIFLNNNTDSTWEITHNDIENLTDFIVDYGSDMYFKGCRTVPEAQEGHHRLGGNSMTNPSLTPNQDELLEILADYWQAVIMEPAGDKEAMWENRAEALAAINTLIDRTVAERLTKHLDNIEASIKQHTVPEGISLVTRSYVINAIEFERTAVQQQKGTE